MSQCLKKMGLGVLLVMFSVVAHSQTSSSDPVAMITDIQGQATLIRVGSPEEAEILSSLYQGDRVNVEQNADLVLVYYENGKEYHFTGPAYIEIDGDGPKVVSGKAASSRELKLIKEIKLNSSQGSLHQAAVRLRGFTIKKKKIKLLSPVDAKLIDAHPNFRWEAFQNATQFRFTLTDENGKSMLETTVKGYEFLLPATIQMEAGMFYRWQVETRLDNGAAYVSIADFNIVPGFIQDKMANLKPKENATFSEILVYAQFLEQQGFTVDSRTYWLELSRQRPDSNELKRLAE